MGTFSITTYGTTDYTGGVTQTSQFYSKTDTHEGVHRSQLQPSGILGAYWTNAGLWSAVQNVTASSEALLVSATNAAAANYATAQAAAAKSGSCDQSEIDAYAVSDSVAPQYVYQRCNRTTFPNCH
jgi:hypothetical protein